MDKSTKHLPRESLGDSYNSVHKRRLETLRFSILKIKIVIEIREILNISLCLEFIYIFGEFNGKVARLHK